MSGAAFIRAAEVNREQWPGMGDLGLVSLSVEPERLAFGDLVFGPGDGFNFHSHPRQDEVLYLMEGRLEAWIETEKTILEAGDTMYLPAGSVHACFNTFDESAKMFVAVTPPVATEETRIEIVDRSEDEPYRSLR